MRDSLVKKLRTSPKGKRLFLAIKLAYDGGRGGISELKRMVNGERRRFLRRYNYKDQLIGIEALGESKSLEALDFLSEVYSASYESKHGDSFRVYPIQGSGDLAVYEPIQIDSFTFPWAKRKLRKMLSYSVELDKGRYRHESSVDDFSPRSRKDIEEDIRSVFREEPHVIIQRAIKKLEKTTGEKAQIFTYKRFKDDYIRISDEDKGKNSTQNFKSFSRFYEIKKEPDIFNIRKITPPETVEDIIESIGQGARFKRYDVFNDKNMRKTKGILEMIIKYPNHLENVKMEEILEEVNNSYDDRIKNLLKEKLRKRNMSDAFVEVIKNPKDFFIEMINLEKRGIDYTFQYIPESSEVVEEWKDGPDSWEYYGGSCWVNYGKYEKVLAGSHVETTPENFIIKRLD